MDNQHATPASSHGAASSGQFLKDLEKFFDTYLNKKAPFHLPSDAKMWLVKLAPWLTLVVMLWALQVFWAGYHFVQYVNSLTPYVYGNYYGYHPGITYYLALLLTAGAFILQAMSLPGLFNKTSKGWQMLYYSSLVAAIAELISGNILGAIVGLIIALYFLFQVKEYYK